MNSINLDYDQKENMKRKMQGLYNSVENLMQQRHDRDQSESQLHQFCWFIKRKLV